MKRKRSACVAAAIVCALAAPAVAAGWLQWGAGPTHDNASSASGQRPDYTLADIVYDALVPKQDATLFVHYQAPIVDGDDVFMTFKSGTYTDAAHWETQVWNVKRLSWNEGVLGETWSVASDWKPEPNALAGWEPVFHPAVHGNVVYAPGASGSLLRLDRGDGHDLGRVSPFGNNAQVYVAGPLAIDGDGNVFYNAMQLDAASPASSDVLGAWLVRVTPAGVATTVDYDVLVPGAPAATAACEGQFASADLPWPPAPDAVVPDAPLPCGSQRPGINVAPAIASDGTIYTVSRAHRNDRYGYLVAVNPDLSPKWAASLRGRFDDGCNVLVPTNGSDGGCRIGATTGVDPATNHPGAGRVADQASSSPVVAPDGAILYGAYTRYNYSSGHLMKFAPNGDYLGSYPFGWDLTPAIWRHDGTYSIVLKENHYDSGSYCSFPDAACGRPRSTITPDDPEQFFITQIDAALGVEWKFKSTNTLSCTRQEDGSLDCVDDHPAGFEWCVNAAAVDANGTVFANSEDGALYAIAQGGTQARTRFLQLALGAAYTPLAIGDDGRVYTQNFGRLFVVGTPPDRIFAGGFD